MARRQAGRAGTQAMRSASQRRSGDFRGVRVLLSVVGRIDACRFAFRRSHGGDAPFYFPNEIAVEPGLALIGQHPTGLASPQVQKRAELHSRIYLKLLGKPTLIHDIIQE